MAKLLKIGGCHAVSTWRAFTGLAALVTLSAPASAQIVGGRWETTFSTNGVNASADYGRSVAGVGDTNGDGISDYLVGADGTNVNGRVNAGSAFLYSGANGNLLHRFDGSTAQDRLGFDVNSIGDIDADGRADLIISAFLASPSSGSQAGSVFVYSGSNGALLFQFDGEAPRDSFGNSAAGAGDVDADGTPDVIIGAVGANAAGVRDSGTAYVYSGATGLLLHRFDGNSLGTNGALGFDVDGAGDVDGDGHADLLVGSKSDKVFVYSGATGLLLHQMASNAIGFGQTVRTIGDVNSDGRPDHLVGAPYANGGGRVFLYSGATGTLIQTLLSPGAPADFGDCLDDAGDVNGDGIHDILIGAPYAEPSGLYWAGSAFLYSGADRQLLRTFKASALGDQLGSSVAGIGDINGDGLSEIVLCAIGADPGGFNQGGAATVYSLDPFLTPTAKTLSASGTETVTFALDFPSSEAGVFYGLLVSLQGTGPTNLVGLTIPLTRDNAFVRVRFGPRPPELVNALGTLDQNGDATTASLSSGPSLAPIVGRTMYFAAISLDFGPARGRQVSIARQLVILP